MFLQVKVNTFRRGNHKSYNYRVQWPRRVITVECLRERQGLKQIIEFCDKMIFVNFTALSVVHWSLKS